MIRHIIGIVGLVALATAMLTLSSRAAEKENPTPMIIIPQGPDIKGFVAAYESAKEPKILVLMNQGGNFPAANMFAPTGDAQMLQAEIEQVLIAAKAEVVDLRTISEKDQRELNALAMQGERGAGLLLTQVHNLLHADIVLRVMMGPGGNGAKYRVIVETIQAARGRKIGVFSFDWILGSDAISVKRYGSAVSQKFIEQFMDWYGDRPGGTPVTYTVRLVGVPSAKAVVAFRKSIETVQGVTKVVDGAFTKGEGTTVTELTVSYTGLPLDLMVEMQDAAKRDLQMEIEGTDGNSGTITMVAAKTQANGTVSEADLLWDEVAGKDLRQHIMDQYANEGHPRIAVILNKQITDEDKQNAELADAVKAANADVSATQPAAAGKNSEHAIYVLVNSSLGTAPGAGGAANPDPKTNDPKRNPRPFENTRRMEDYMYKRLLKLKFTMIDPNVARDRLEQEQESARIVYRDDELVYLLGTKAKADIVIHGYGRVDHSETGTSVSYTVRAVRVNDGVTLAADGWAGTLTSDDMSNVDNVMENIATYLVTSVTLQMRDAWTPPHMLNITVTNCPSQREVFAIMDAFKNNIGDIVSADFERHVSGTEGGMGYFTIRYRSSFEELIKRITEQQKNLVFDLDAHDTSANSLTVHLIKKL